MWLGTVVHREGTNKKCSLLADLRITVLHQGRCDGNEIIVDHLIGRFLVMHKLVERLECISAFCRLEVLLKQDLLELHNSPVENCDSDLVRNDLGGELFLQVRMSCLH